MFNTLTKIIAEILITPIIFVGSLAGYTFDKQVSPKSSSNLGSAQNFNPVGATQFTLAGAGVTSSQTTITLSSFKTPGGLNLTMANFGNIGYGALESQSTSKLENISFSGVVQNVNGTATLTGVVRGMDFVYPYQASTTLQKSHAGGATFILTNTAGFYGQQFPFLQNDQTFTGINTFTYSPIVNDSNSTSTSQLATRAYANSLAIQGAATSTQTASGIGLLSTGAQAAAGTYNLTTPRFVSTLISTSTYFGNDNNKSIITKTNGSLANTIDPNFIATTSNYTWGGTALFTASTTISGQSMLASTTAQKILIQQVVDAPLMNKILATSTNVSINNSVASTTLLSFTIPGNTLSTNNGVRVQLRVSQMAISGNNAFTLEGQYGGSAIFDLSTSTKSSGQWNGGVGQIDFVIQGNGSTSSQEGDISINVIDYSNSASGGSPNTFFLIKTATGSTAVDSTVNQTFNLIGRFNVADAADANLTITDAQVWTLK